jgi:hypothetical protein
MDQWKGIEYERFAAALGGKKIELELFVTYSYLQHLIPICWLLYCNLVHAVGGKKASIKKLCC